MTFKELLDKHPLPSLVVVAVGIASTTAGVVTYIEGVKFGGEQIKLEAKYSSDINALKRQLAGINRGLGKNENNYFDVSQLTITRDDIRSLDQAYESVSNGQFFYQTPIGDPWRYELISEGEFYAQKINSTEPTAELSEFASIAQKNLHLWKKGQPLVVSTKTNNMSLNFFPMVAVQVITEDHLKTITADLTMASKNDIDIKSITAEINKLKEELSGTLPPTEKTITNISSNDTSQTHTNSTTPNTERNPGSSGDKQLEMEKMLGTMFRGDIAAFLLGALIMQSFQATLMMDGVENNLSTIQKKGNVVYVKMSLTFNNAKIAGFEKAVTLVVNRELFIVTTKNLIYLVQVEVPTLDGRSDANQWIGQWLSSLRIPIDAQTM